MPMPSGSSSTASSMACDFIASGFMLTAIAAFSFALANGSSDPKPSSGAPASALPTTMAVSRFTLVPDVTPRPSAMPSRSRFCFFKAFTHTRMRTKPTMKSAAAPSAMSRMGSKTPRAVSVASPAAAASAACWPANASSFRPHVASVY